MLAQSLAKIFNTTCSVLILPKSEMNITDLDSVLKTVERFKPELILNTAAFTHVDNNELFPDESYRVNALGARNVAVAARLVGARLVHFSTDFVFDGEKQGAYQEWDHPNPLSVYGRAKLAGEELIRQTYGMHYIVRTSWLFGENGKNLLSTLHRKLLAKQNVRAISDQIGSPTYSLDLARAVKMLVQIPAFGTYHLSNNGCCTRFQLAKEAAALLNCPEHLVTPVSSRELNLPAARPGNSVLDNYCWRLMGFPPLRHYRLAYREFLQGQGVH
jgi:dTDP-4-dehydrorhamnose reductase